MQIAEGCGYVRTIVPSSRGGADGLLYVGTTKNSVLHGSLQDKMATVIHVSSLPLLIALVSHIVDFSSDFSCLITGCFYRAALNATRSSHDKAVRPSVHQTRAL